MTLFGGYVFGGKFIDAYKKNKKSKDDKSSDELLNS